jgi:hypothetical protein
LSIYDHLPIWLMIVVAIVLLLSVTLTIAFLYYGWRAHALFALLPTLTVFICLPYLAQQLGYLTRYGDPITHAGFIKDVTLTGEPPGIIYPLLHILGSVVSQITGFPAYAALEILNILMSVCLILTFAVFARYANLPTAAVLLFVPLMISSNITPAVFTYSTVFILAIFTVTKSYYLQTIRRSENLDRRFVALLMVFSVIWIYHVIPAAVLFAVIAVSAVIAGRPIRSIAGRIVPDSSLPNITARAPRRLLVSFSLIGFLWISTTWLLRRSIFLGLAVIGENTVQPGNLSAGSVTDALFGTFGFTLIDIAFLAVKRFGNIGVLFAFACLGSVVYLLRRESKYRIPLFIIAAVPFTGLWSVEEFVISAIPSISFLRALRPGRFLAPLLAGYLLWMIVRIIQDRVRWRTVTAITLALTVIIVAAGSGIAARNSYASPWIVNKNGYFLDSDVEGMEFYYAYKDQAINTTTLWRSNDRWMDYLMRPQQRQDRAEELHYKLETNEYRAPDHFGYPGNATLANSTGCSYYVEGTYDRRLLLKAWAELDRFNRQDFRRFSSDPSVDQLYANGNVNISTVGCST